ncbi:MAG: 3-hexulose-6-phosphate synthase [Candidatus Micrarchaeota archaeon]
MAILQLAMDIFDLERALAIARDAAKYVDWMEVGTPLIKSEGMNAVREFRRAFPHKEIVADMKTMDVGAAEVEMAAKAGAGIVTVMGASDDSTIKEAVEAGKRYGAKIMVDILGCAPARAREVEKLGASYLCIHVGIDQQMRGADAMRELHALSQKVKIPIAVAGGINSESAPLLARAGASIIIVGGAITKARNVAKEAESIRRALASGKPVRAEIKKYGGREIRGAFLRASTPNVSDAMQRKGEMRGVRAIVEGVKMVGQAFTVRTYPGDWAKPVEAVDEAKEGDVLVIDSGGVGGGGKAVWGELATWSCVRKKIAGVVIDGAIRDVDEIRKLKFPAFARSITPTAGEPRGMGELRVEINCGGVSVRPGDWIIGDDNGVVVVPAECALEMANRALDVLEKENRIREEIKKGSTLAKTTYLKKWEKVK